MNSQKYFAKDNQQLDLGKEIGKGGVSNTYLLASDQSKAVKIFKTEFLKQETNLAKRIEKLIQLSQLADVEVPFGGVKKVIGAWPQDIVKDDSGSVTGYITSLQDSGIDLSYIVMARNSNTAFYKYRNSPNYAKWKKYFLYNSESLKNRFTLSYCLSLFFDKMYNLKSKDNKTVDLEICNFDIKPQNILVSIESINGKDFIVPYIIDLDNLTLKNSTGKLAPSTIQFSPEYRAPEGPIDKYYDYWSIAVIFYQLIFNQHPFDAVIGGEKFTEGTEREYFIQNKCFPWGRNRAFLSKQTQDDFRHGNFLKVSTEIQQLFIRAFDSDLPSQRPSMAEWGKAFLAFLQNAEIDFKNLFAFEEAELPSEINAPEIIIDFSDSGSNSLPSEENNLPSQNREVKHPVVLLVETSGFLAEEHNGMAAIDELNKTLQSIKNQILEDPILSTRLDLAVVGFDEVARLEMDFTVLNPETNMPVLKPRGRADLAAGMNLAMQLLEDRKSYYLSNDDSFYRPYLILITEGKHCNTPDEIYSLDSVIQQMVDSKEFVFLPFGVRNADMHLLAKLAAHSTDERMTNRGLAYHLNDIRSFTDIFVYPDSDDLDDFITWNHPTTWNSGARMASQDELTVPMSAPHF
jgi:uncharacterized protein YegL/serine/threonine protein kinase